MSDEETQDILEPSDGEQEISNEDTPSDDDTRTYCEPDDVLSFCGDLSDEADDELLATAIANSTSWIESNLKQNYVPIPTTHVGALKTVAIYHSVSDIILNLYHGDDLITQYDTWFQKAQSLLQQYIDAYLKSEAPEDELVTHQVVKHSKALTYNQKRGRGGLWVR